MHPAARRILREMPLLAVAAVVAGVAVAVVVLGAARMGSAALFPLAGAAALVWVVLWWRARPSYGRRRGLAPGTLSVRSSLDALADRSFLRHSFERYGPVFKMAQFHRPVVCVVGLERGRELLRRHSDDIRPAPLGRDDTVPRGVVVSMERADYAVYAPLLRGALAEVVSVRSRDVSRPLARASCTTLAATPRASVPLVREVVEDYVMSSLLDLYFGRMLQPGDRDTIEGCLSNAMEVGIRSRPTRDAMAAVERFVELIRVRAGVPVEPDDVSYWTEIVRRAPAAADDPTVLGNLCHLLADARNNISGATTWATWFLAQSPGWLGVVREAGGESDSRSDPATAAVLETLRLARSEYVYRCVERPIDVDGLTIPAGWLVRICLAESHLLDPPFTNPLQFEPERHLRTRFGPADFAPFGLDTHGCLGARLTIELARSFVEALSGYTPVIEEIGPPRRGTRHWSHWSIGSDFRLGLVSIGSETTPEPAVALVAQGQ